MNFDEVKNIFDTLPEFVGVSPTSLVPLKGDASGRRYSRVFLSMAPYSVILMELDDAVGPVIDGNVKLLQRETFPEVAKFISKYRYPIPRIIIDKHNEKLLIVEDVGDVSLARLCRESSAKDVSQVILKLGKDPIGTAFKKAIDIIAELQSIPECDHFVFKRSLSKGALFTEARRFIDFFAKPKGASIEDLKVMEQEILNLTEKVSRHPMALAHRDFMPMNIHLRADGEVVVIDFQDMLMASKAYDVGALLTDRDIDHDLGSKRVAELVKYAEGKLNVSGFKELFDDVVLQRTLRLIGQFTDLAQRKSPAYADFVPGSLRRAKTILNNRSDLPTVRKFLDSL